VQFSWGDLQQGMTTSKDDSVRPVVTGLLLRRGRNGFAFSIYQAGNRWKILPGIYGRALARTGSLETDSVC
jgi:hypothetical protein